MSSDELSTTTDELNLIEPGHWETLDGREMARRYAAMERGRLGMADMTDFRLSNALYMVDHHDIGYQTAAKDRIRWLSVQLALASAKAIAPQVAADAPPAEPDRAAIVAFLQTDAVYDILSYMCFELGRTAALFRATGDDIKHKAEDEQAHMMRWMLTLAAEHGNQWTAAAGEEVARRRALLSKVDEARTRFMLSQDRTWPSSSCAWPRRPPAG